MTTPVLQTANLILQPLTHIDAEVIGHLYNDPQVSLHYDVESLCTPEQVSDFITRIITSSVAIWSVRLIANPDIIIGDCAIHHHSVINRSIEMGGSLFPNYWGKSYMAEALTAMENFSVSQLNIRKIILNTPSENYKAICFALKQGFVITEKGEGSITSLVKDLLS